MEHYTRCDRRTEFPIQFRLRKFHCSIWYPKYTASQPAISSTRRKNANRRPSLRTRYISTQTQTLSERQKCCCFT